MPLDNHEEKQEELDLNQSLIVYIRRGNLRRVQDTLKKGANANVVYEDGWTALTYAVNYTLNIALISTLIEYNADINAKNREGKTALMYAAMNGSVNIARLLIKNRADVNVVDTEGCTPLIYSAIRGNNQLTMMQLLRENEADVNRANHEGRTPLMYVAERPDHLNNKLAAQFLIDNGAIIDTADNNGDTALIIAARNDNQAIADILIKGGTIEAANNQGETPLISAAMAGNAEMIELLLEKGANVNAVNEVNNTALFYLIRQLITITNDQFRDESKIPNLLKAAVQMIEHDSNINEEIAAILAEFLVKNHLTMSENIISLLVTLPEDQILKTILKSTLTKLDTLINHTLKRISEEYFFVLLTYFIEERKQEEKEAEKLAIQVLTQSFTDISEEGEMIILNDMQANDRLRNQLTQFYYPLVRTLPKKGLRDAIHKIASFLPVEDNEVSSEAEFLLLSAIERKQHESAGELQKSPIELLNLYKLLNRVQQNRQEREAERIMALKVNADEAIAEIDVTSQSAGEEVKYSFKYYGEAEGESLQSEETIQEKIFTDKITILRENEEKNPSSGPIIVRGAEQLALQALFRAA